MTIEEKLKHFEDVSMAQARARSAAILRQYRAELDAAGRRHRAETARQAARQLKAESARLCREKAKALSQKRLELKRQTIEKQTALKEELFAEIRVRLEDYMASPAYEELLLRQIRAITEFAQGEPVTIYLDPADAGRAPSLEAAAHIRLSVSSSSFLGGTRAVLHKRRILIDNSFATRLAEEKESFTFEGSV